jgi:MFS family permease
VTAEALVEAQPGALAPLHERDYRLFFFGNVTSNLGTFCQTIAQSLLVYRLSGSTFLVGLVNFAQFAAVPVLAPAAGAAADRFDRRRLLIASQVAAFAVTALLTALSAIGDAHVWVVIGLAGALGVTSAFAFPVNRALSPALVSDRNLGRAVNLDSVSVNVARALGPVSGAFVVARFGVTWAFAINSLSFLLLAVALWFVRPRPQLVAPGRVRFFDGLKVLRRQPLVAALLFIVACCALAADPPLTLGPELAHHFGGGDTLAGVILGAFGAGAVLGAFVAGAEARRHHRKVAVLLGLLVAGTVVFALAGWLPLALGGAVLAGFGYLTAQTRTTTLLYRSIGDHERGRVMALWTMAFIGTRPLASLVDGAIGAAAGVRMAALAMALPAAAACLVSARLHHRTTAEIR